MYCTKCGNILMENERVCSNCGEVVKTEGIEPEMEPKSIGEASIKDSLDKIYSDNAYVQPKSKVIIFCEALGEICSAIAGIGLAIMLIWYIQIWPYHIYKVGCHYLESNVFGENADYDFVKYNKRAVGEVNSKNFYNFGEGKMSYHQFHVAIPVKFHTEEFGDITWTFDMDIYVHPFGEKGVWERSRYIRCSGKPRQLQELQKMFDEWDESIGEGTDNYQQNEGNGAYADTIDVVSGKYESLNYDATLSLNIYSSPEDNEIGNYEYKGEEGLVIYDQGQYRLCSDDGSIMRLEMEESSDELTKVGLWDLDGKTKYDQLVLVERYES